MGDEISNSLTYPGYSGGELLSQTPKKCNSLEAMTAYAFAPASEPILTNSAEF